MLWRAGSSKSASFGARNLQKPARVAGSVNALCLLIGMQNMAMDNNIQAYTSSGSVPALPAPDAREAAAVGACGDKRPTSLDEILSSPLGRRFYSDGPPMWTQGGKRGPAKTAAQAEHERALLVKALVRDGGADALHLADRLDRCRSSQRCIGGACPECARAAQRVFVCAGGKVLERCSGDLVVIDVDWSLGTIGDEYLCSEEVFAATRRLIARSLREVGVRAFGGFDISANEHERGDFDPQWSPHACLFTPRQEMERNEKTFRAWFPSSPETPRPVRMRRFDGEIRGLANAFSPDFYRRISLAPRILPGGKRLTLDTREEPILGERRIELALALDLEGLDARLFLHGYELAVVDDDVEIVRSPSGAR
jgi:hypothetical protein